MNSGLLIMILVIIADLVLVAEILYFILRKAVSNKLIQAAFERNEEKFDAIRHTLIAKTLSDFDIELIRYNVAEIRKDQTQLEEQIRKFEKMDLSAGQQKKIYPRIFYHYIDRGRREDAKAYYDRLSRFNVYSNKKDIEMTYDAYVRGSHKYLDEALKQLPRTPKQELPAKERLVAKLYENKGIRQEAKKYERLAERHENELIRR